MYTILFNDGTDSNTGDSFHTLEDAKAYINSNNRTEYSYFPDYRGGVAQVLNEETDTVVYEEEIY